jgi:uncharacterized radical SAM protein YgiQ
VFIPTTKEETTRLGWEKLDIILVSGDTYIDYSYNGIAIIGKLLIDKGYRVGIIAQPDINSKTDISRLGEPDLFWGISSGSVDSMISNYTPSMKKRKMDDLTPGGINNKRPDRALIAYTNLIRRYFKNTKPIILGGIEASLRRIAHYDYWSNSIRRSVLFDAKADLIIYGMAEETVLKIADCFKNGADYQSLNGICYISKKPNSNFIDLPSYEESSSDKNKFIEMFDLFYKNNDPLTAKGLNQKHGDRYLIHNPPAPKIAQKLLDYIYNLSYERDVHPYYKSLGEVRALDTARFSITTHRGCFGECNFCSIAVHQGNTVVSRSIESILKEAEDISRHPKFNGIINDVGGPTANMYGFECEKKIEKGKCIDKRCLFPDNCPKININHKIQIELLKKLSLIPGMRRIFIASGIRYDLIVNDKKYGEEYLCYIMKNNISGQLKIAPEHCDDEILNLMGKPANNKLLRFLELFKKINNSLGKRIYLTYYFIAAHPGSTLESMKKLNTFIKGALKINPEQVQIFTPSPSTYSTLMYYTSSDPFTNKKIFVEKDINKKNIQKAAIVSLKKKYS